MDLTNGVFLCNPPYGERMGDQKSCRRLYAAMGKLFRRNPTWSMTVIATDPAFEEFFGMKITAYDLGFTILLCDA